MKERLKKFGKWILDGLFTIWLMLPKPVLIAGIISFIIGWIWTANIAVIVFMCLIGVIIGYVWLRQLWWYITSTGDYEKDNNKKE